MDAQSINFEIHLMSETDIAEVINIQTECGLSPWSHQGYVAEVGDQDSICLIIKNEYEIAGFLIAGLTPSDMSGELYNIGVRQKYRRYGLGSGLLQSMTKKAQDAGITRVFLEVRKSNKGAIHFYEKHRFETVGLRKGFYRDPAEDGISMRLRISRE